MIGSILKYRVPGEKVVERDGSFKKLSPEEVNEFNGFVVTDFKLGQIYGFEDGVECLSNSSDRSEPICIKEEQYLGLAKQYIEALNQGDVKKIILSRVQEESTLKSPFELFDILENQYPNAFVYLVQSPLFGIWIGATPERLIKSQGDASFMVSLAGTKAENDDSPWRQKEIEEQAYVTDYIEHRLRGLNIEEIEIKGPGQLYAGPVKHLYTELTFKTPKDLWQLVSELHPTPAVCGIPKENAMDLISATEPHDRSLYAGVIGVLDDRKTELFVNLRCAQIISQKVYLYLGGGLTKYSIPEEEWEETLNKAKTLKKFL